jgi:1-acyl-sn-glycerol-3-phosphate acyltransferase
LPKTGPVLMAVNHPTAFTEPAIIGVLFKRDIHFILKGNIFSTPFLKWFLHEMKMIPIFRLRDGGGFSSLRQNTETMETVNRKLTEGEIILILAEGVRKNEKRVRPIQKGAARMAFAYLEKTKRDDLAIINVGVNYTEATKYRSDLMIDVAPPLWLKDYTALHEEHDRKAITKLTKDIGEGLLERVIHVNQEADDALVNHLLDFNRNNRKENVLPIVEIRNKKPLQEELAIAQKVNELDDAKKENLRQNVANYLKKLKDLKLDDFGVARPEAANFSRFLFILLGAIPALLGFLINCTPVLYAKKFSKKIAKMPEDYASYRAPIGLIFYFCYWLLLLIPLAIFWGWIGVEICSILPFWGYFYIVWKGKMEGWKWARKFKGLDKNEQEIILKMRKDVLS